MFGCNQEGCNFQDTFTLASSTFCLISDDNNDAIDHRLPSAVNMSVALESTFPTEEPAEDNTLHAKRSDKATCPGTVKDVRTGWKYPNLLVIDASAASSFKFPASFSVGAKTWHLAGFIIAHLGVEDPIDARTVNVQLQTAFSAHPELARGRHFSAIVRGPGDVELWRQLEASGYVKERSDDFYAYDGVLDSGTGRKVASTAEELLEKLPTLFDWTCRRIVGAVYERPLTEGERGSIKALARRCGFVAY